VIILTARNTEPILLPQRASTSASEETSLRMRSFTLEPSLKVTYSAWEDVIRRLFNSVGYGFGVILRFWRLFPVAPEVLMSELFPVCLSALVPQRNLV